MVDDVIVDGDDMGFRVGHLGGEQFFVGPRVGCRPEDLQPPITLHLNGLRQDLVGKFLA